MKYDDFVIQIDADPNGDYTVRVEASPAGLGNGVMRLPTPLRTPDSLLAVQEIGEELSHALFKGQIRRLCEQSLRILAAVPNHGLRFLLKIDPSDPATDRLANLPWELLKRTDTDQFLSLSSPVVRYVQTPFPQTSIPLREELRVLALLSNPVGHEPLDLEKERCSLYDAWAGIEDIEITFLERMDGVSLHKILLERDYHVFHFIGHGGFDSTGESGLFLESKTGLSELTAGSTLVELLTGIESLRLVVLNACQGARVSEGTGSNPFVKIAASLVANGLPAAMAVPSALSEREASVFSRAFYGCLANGDPVDGALVEGRRSIHSALPSSFEWMTPILFMRVADGAILHRQTPTKSRIASVSILHKNVESVLAEPSIIKPIKCSPDSGIEQCEERNNKLSQVLDRLRISFEEVKVDYSDPPRRELSWRQLQHLVNLPLWEAVESLDGDPFRRQLADVLDAAVSRLEAFQLNDHHFSAFETTLERLSAKLVEEGDVDDCENGWRAAEVDTLPSLREAFEEWLINTNTGVENVG